jgi:hypothetical protein
MKSWIWWVVGGVALYFTRDIWMPWLGLGAPGKLPEVANSASKSGSSYYSKSGRPPPPASAGVGKK